MAQQNKNNYEGTFNSPTTGLFKANTTGDIGADDAQTLVTNTKDSVPFTLDDSYTWAFPKVETSGTNTYTGTLSPAITAYTNGMKVHVKIKTASTGASTLNLNSVGAKKIFTNPTTQAGSGDLVDEQDYLMTYDSALDTAAGGWLIMGAGSSSSGTSIPFGTTSGTNTYTIAATPAVTAYADGDLFLIKVANGSTNLSTFNFDSVGAKKAYATPEEQITDGYLEDNRFYLFSYDSTLDGGAGGFLQVNESNHSVVNMIAGVWDASGGLLPSTTGSGPSGQVKHGDAFIISPGGTVSGTVLSVKDLIIAGVDSPGQTLGNWLLISGLLSTDIKLALKANLASPTFTGTPAAPTAGAGTNTTQVATTAFVQQELRKTRTVTGADSLVQGDDNSLIIFNSASDFNFTLDQLTTSSKFSFYNIGAGAVTFINGSGVTLAGDPIIPGAVGTIYPSGLVNYESATTPRVVNPSIEPDVVTVDTSGATITLDFALKAQRVFVGSASFATPKTIALSNETNAVAFQIILNMSNIAAVLTFPTTFTMQNSDDRWVDADHEFTPEVTSKHKFVATNDGTDYLMEASNPYS